ncbi:Gfo/Idh/MocA family protein [Bradyrhizobium liaoningense]
MGRPVSGQAGVAIVGCGLIGQKRAKALGGRRLVVCADIAQDRADRLAATVPGCKAVTDWQLAVNDPAVSIVIISTLHDTLAEIAKGAVAAGKHVLIEKPAARRAAELAGLAETRCRQWQPRAGRVQSSLSPCAAKSA